MTCQNFINGRCRNRCALCKVTGKRQDGLPDGTQPEDYDGEDFT